MKNESGRATGGEFQDRHGVGSSRHRAEAGEGGSGFRPEGWRACHEEHGPLDGARRVRSAERTETIGQNLSGAVRSHLARVATGADMRGYDRAGRIDEDELGLRPAAIDADFEGRSAQVRISC